MSTQTIQERLKEFTGQKIALICARYQYRGVLTEVADDHCMLANATSVEVSGPCNRERPQTEDPIDGSIMIMLGAVELIYQPRWVNAPLPSEEGYQQTGN